MNKAKHFQYKNENEIGKKMHELKCKPKTLAEDETQGSVRKTTKPDGELRKEKSVEITWTTKEKRREWELRIENLGLGIKNVYVGLWSYFTIPTHLNYTCYFLFVELES